MGKRVVGLVLAAMLALNVPVSVLASDSKTEEQIIDLENDDTNLSGEESISDKDFESKSDSETEESDQKQISLNDCIIILSKDCYVCDGKVKKPNVIVKYGDSVLEKDKDYLVEYQNNINIGTASVKIIGIGAFTDSKVENFKIMLGKTTLKSTSSYSAINLKWDKVAGASGYIIYRSTSNTTGFKSIKKIESGITSAYSDTNTKFNKVYYYKICAYGIADAKTVYGEKSSVREQRKKLAAPQIAKISSSVNSVKITWKKVKGASGYIIYRSSSENGTYKKIASLNKSSEVSYTNKNLSSSTTYYYKVKAYRRINKKNYYGYVSAPKAVTTKKFAGGWKYVNGYKLYYDKNGKLVKDVSSIIGKQSSYVIKVNKKQNCVTVYAKDGKNGYIIPVKAFPCSAGYATPITTARTPAKYRWHELNGNCYGQWCTRIKQGFLFHSVMYGKPKKTSLSVSNYNKLGTTASHGCIRLRAGDAKWIYDNCKLKTKVIIYNSSNPGPLGKPSAVKLPKWHKWDPTDPTARYLCKQRGCH